VHLRILSEAPVENVLDAPDRVAGVVEKAVEAIHDLLGRARGSVLVEDDGHRTSQRLFRKAQDEGHGLRRRGNGSPAHGIAMEVTQVRGVQVHGKLDDPAEDRLAGVAGPDALHLQAGRRGGQDGLLDRYQVRWVERLAANRDPNGERDVLARDREFGNVLQEVEHRLDGLAGAARGRSLPGRSGARHLVEEGRGDEGPSRVPGGKHSPAHHQPVCAARLEPHRREQNGCVVGSSVRGGVASDLQREGDETAEARTVRVHVVEGDRGEGIDRAELVLREVRGVYAFGEADHD
jgi:hypothetical protein